MRRAQRGRCRARPGRARARPSRRARGPRSARAWARPPAAGSRPRRPPRPGPSIPTGGRCGRRARRGPPRRSPAYPGWDRPRDAARSRPGGTPGPGRGRGAIATRRDAGGDHGVGGDDPEQLLQRAPPRRGIPGEDVALRRPVAVGDHEGGQLVPQHDEPARTRRRPPPRAARPASPRRTPPMTGAGSRRTARGSGRGAGRCGRRSLRTCAGSRRTSRGRACPPPRDASPRRAAPPGSRR